MMQAVLFENKKINKEYLLSLDWEIITSEVLKAKDNKYSYVLRRETSYSETYKRYFIFKKMTKRTMAQYCSLKIYSIGNNCLEIGITSNLYTLIANKEVKKIKSNIDFDDLNS
jgi:hypothetical protein